MIDAAIIGLGWWGRRHVEAVREAGAGLRYVLGVTHEADEITEFANRHQLPIATDYATALADPAIRAVVLATPHTLHPAQVEAAAEAGKHVFCEKPFALDAGDAARAVAACRRAGVVLGVGHDWRYRPALVEIKRMIEAGELGTVMQVEANYSHDILADVPPGTWRADAAEAPAGGMTGMGVHITDCFIAMLGEVREVHARIADRVLGRGSGDTLAVTLAFANGALGYLGTTMMTAYLWHVRVLGSEGHRRGAERIGARRPAPRRRSQHPESGAGRWTPRRHRGVRRGHRIGRRLSHPPRSDHPQRGRASGHRPVDPERPARAGRLGYFSLTRSRCRPDRRRSRPGGGAAPRRCRRRARG